MFGQFFSIRCIYLVLFIFNFGLLEAVVDPAPKLIKSVDSVLKILYNESTPNSKLNRSDIESSILSYLSSQYNLDIIIRRTLGRNWKKIGNEDRVQILELIKQLVLRAYIDGMTGKSKPTIVFYKTRYISDKRAEVPQSVSFKGLEIALIYRLGLIENKWQIFDLVIEDMSIVASYRNQFDIYFSKHSSGELIKKLKILLLDENLGNALPL